MAPAPKPTVPKAAKPRFGAHFDAWNSSSTGHQRPDILTPGPGWRDSRNKKLNSQFQAGGSGGERQSDTWGAGAEDWDAEMKVLVPKSLKERKGRTVMDLLQQPGMMADMSTSQGLESREDLVMESRRKEDEEREASKETRRPIFDGVVVYVNGSTFPLISDHKLKHLLSEHGGNTSLHLGRRKVTHVILGRPAGSASGAGAGGGLAGGKLEREIKKIHGVGVKFVGVEWVLESLKAGKRLPEARFSNMKIAPKGQGSVYGLYAEKKTGEAAKTATTTRDGDS